MSAIDLSPVTDFDNNDKHLFVLYPGQYPILANTPSPKLSKIAFELSSQGLRIRADTFFQIFNDLLGYRSSQPG